MVKKEGLRKGECGVRGVASRWVKEGKEVKEGNSCLWSRFLGQPRAVDGAGLSASCKAMTTGVTAEGRQWKQVKGGSTGARSCRLPTRIQRIASCGSLPWVYYTCLIQHSQVLIPVGHIMTFDTFWTPSSALCQLPLIKDEGIMPSDELLLPLRQN